MRFQLFVQMSLVALAAAAPVANTEKEASALCAAFAEPCDGFVANQA